MTNIIKLDRGLLLFCVAEIVLFSKFIFYDKHFSALLRLRKTLSGICKKSIAKSSLYADLILIELIPEICIKNI